MILYHRQCHCVSLWSKDITHSTFPFTCYQRQRLTQFWVSQPHRSSTELKYEIPTQQLCLGHSGMHHFILLCTRCNCLFGKDLISSNQQEIVKGYGEDGFIPSEVVEIKYSLCMQVNIISCDLDQGECHHKSTQLNRLGLTWASQWHLWDLPVCYVSVFKMNSNWNNKNHHPWSHIPRKLVYWSRQAHKHKWVLIIWGLWMHCPNMVLNVHWIS